ncbi:hypothetical protein KA025_00785 [Candidatus Saccharibacteria bacterium]|jgi:3-deoxy-D-arabino-heptulosonate 7-phosphate (DAHP) synthase|nr:hypothetical protein [Candidatus Saccharibacteria bacterium]MBP7834602.1 hypothetical protein [Candidatus Saccharibacteria bacterium]
MEKLSATKQLAGAPSKDTELAILNKRLQISTAIKEGIGTIAIIGPCALDNNESVLLEESKQLHDLQNETGLITISRRAFWKPRSNPESWPGLETTDPYDSYRLILGNAQKFANNSAEIGHFEHIEKYGPLLNFGWFGARNKIQGFKKQVADWDHSLSFGVKNDLNGTIDDALSEIEEINSSRHHIENSGKAILIYRGGNNAQNPDAWTNNYLDALERTNGRLIVDTAHGAEMAFHPNGIYKKSVAGQQASLAKVLELADKGAIPLGVMMEASDTIETTDDRKVDPNMPFHIAIEGLRRLSAIAKPISID